MVKVTGAEVSTSPPSRSSRAGKLGSKDVPVTFETPRTRQKTRAAAAVHAAAVAAVQAAASNGDLPQLDSDNQSGSPDLHSYPKSPLQVKTKDFYVFGF